MIISENISDAVKFLTAGKIIAYPTEGVYGLGCDPFNSEAVSLLNTVKERNPGKGFIIIASDWSQITDLIQPITSDQSEKINKTWPGAMTWVFRASPKAPNWLLGEHSSIAIRMTDHPIAKKLCELFAKPIVSTSANLSGYPPAKTYQEVEQYFSHQISFILKGAVGGLSKPTPIQDIVTGEFKRL